MIDDMDIKLKVKGRPLPVCYNPLHQKGFILKPGEPKTLLILWYQKIGLFETLDMLWWRYE